MNQAPLYVDISAWQASDIDWKTYCKWAASFDGVSRVTMRSSYGHGYTDAHFQRYRQGALAAGITQIIFYHYAYPQYNSAIAEADWQYQVVGAIRPQDVVMLDYEEDTPHATADWAYAWLARQEANYGGKLPTIYASDAYIRARLQDSRLTKYLLTLANWQFTPLERPPCPPPWRTYSYLQYTDRATNIPGIPGAVDANIYLGVEGAQTMVPTGWIDKGEGGEQRLYNPAASPYPNVYAKGALREFILASSWQHHDYLLALEERVASVELGFPAGPGLRQFSLYHELGWTQAKGVYLVSVGREAKMALDQLATSSPTPLGTSGTAAAAAPHDL